MSASVSVRRVGAEAQPVAVIDGFAPDPDALRAAAAAATFGAAGEHYPGVRAPLPAGYFNDVGGVLAQVLARVFGASGRAKILDASFSIVTTAPATLTSEQRLPHVDAFEPGRIALVHYLAPGDADGTAFYRHRSTGWEAIGPERAAAYLARLQSELAVGMPTPEGYIVGDNHLFERTGLVEARYNRAVLYRSAVLHSGAITPGRALPADPSTGRLTVTGFLAAS